MASEHTRLKRIIGNKVRELRKQKALTQKAVMEASGLSIDTLSRIETGAAQNPNLSTFVQLAEALDVEVGDLFPRGQDSSLTEVEQELLSVLKRLDGETQEALLLALNRLLSR